MCRGIITFQSTAAIMTTDMQLLLFQEVLLLIKY